MSECNFQSLALRLLRGGVAPRHVRRTVDELRDHFEDLKVEALERGASVDEAEKSALARIGTEDAIVQDILAKPELQSWAAHCALGGLWTGSRHLICPARC